MTISGKILRAEYDECITAWDADLPCEICFTRGQVRALLSQTEFLHWTTRWYSESGAALDTDLIDAFASDLECKLIMSGCGNVEILRRVNPDTGVTEISTDGGASWQPDPDDPRNSGIQLAPPIPAGVAADKCAACQSALSVFQDFVNEVIDQKTNEASRAEFLLAIAALLLGLFVGVTWALLPLVLEPVLNLIFAMQLGDITTNMTAAVYQQLICDMFCTIGDDGAWTQSGANLLYNRAVQMPNTTAAGMVQGWLRSIQLLGLNNAAALGRTSVYTCETCNCDQSCDFTYWGIGHGTLVSVTPGEIVIDTEEINGKHFATIYSPNINTCCCDVQQTTVPSTSAERVGVTACGDPIGINENPAYNGFSINYYSVRYPSACRVTITGDECT